MRRAVQRTVEFERVAALPRRQLSQRDADAWAHALTPELLCRGASGALRPWQAYSLAECAENKGGLLGLPVGFGKTLLMWALPTVMGARRPMIILPAGLEPKTRADFRMLRGVWRAPNPSPVLVSKEELARESNAYLLDRHQPDLIMVEESDDLANAGVGAPRRISRYVLPRTRDEVAVVTLTGTLTRTSIMGFWHHLLWCLRENAPVPWDESEARMWAAALDNTRGGIPPSPGPLGPSRSAALDWFFRRVSETPGVVLVDGDSAGDVPLHVRVRVAQECGILDGHFERFMLDHENPRGIPVSTPLDRWCTGGQLGCGLCQYWDPAPPADWVEARRVSAAFVREAIQRTTYSTRPLDTEAQVSRAYPDEPAVSDWLAVRHKFKGTTAVEWLSDATLSTAVDWLAESPEPGIVWCGSVEFAAALSTITGLSYYGAKGQDARGRGLHHADPKRSMICSWHANKRGYNLQAWRRNAVFLPPQSAKYLEQTIGRSHRANQDRPVVFDIFATHGGTYDAFDAAISEARFAKRTTGLTQKILRAEITVEEPTVTASNEFRWARAERD